MPERLGLAYGLERALDRVLEHCLGRELARVPVLESGLALARERGRGEAPG